MIDVALLLPKLVGATGSNPEMAEIAAKIAWGRAAGAGLRRQAVPFRLHNKTLIVSVADAIWQRQLKSMSPELLFRINRLLGSDLVDFIEFRIDPASLAQAQGASTEKTPRGVRQPLPAELLSAAGSITDHDLRERFVRAAENCIARRESRPAK
jgi:hypothetical protein